MKKRLKERIKNGRKRKKERKRNCETRLPITETKKRRIDLTIKKNEAKKSKKISDKKN